MENNTLATHDCVHASAFLPVHTNPIRPRRLHVLSKPFSKSSVFIDEGIRFPSYQCGRSVKTRAKVYAFSNENGLMWTVVHWKGVRIIRKALMLKRCPFRKAYAVE
jgi:hypothetical protein